MKNILRNIFGPSKEEIWSQLEQQINARVVHTQRFLSSDIKVLVEHKNWTIVLDTFHRHEGKTQIPYTRMRCAYDNRDGFRFMIKKEGFFSDLAKYFGMQDIEIGDRIFDDTFILQSKNPAQIKTLLELDSIKQHFMALSDLSLFMVKVKDDEGYWGQTFPEGVDELYLEVRGILKNLEQLKVMFMLFAEIMDRLCQIGSAYETPPNIILK
jgi:hypothetical protein